LREVIDRRFDIVGFAEAVQHDRRAFGGERTGDPEPDPTGRAGYYRNPALQWANGGVRL